MIVTGTVVADPTTVHADGAVVVDDDRIAFVGGSETARNRYPDHAVRDHDIVAPGLVGAHVHSVQSLGRGIADDAPLLEWLTDHVLPMEASLGPEELYTAAALGYLECLASGVTCVQDHLTVHHADRAFAAAGDVGIRGVLGKVLMDREGPDPLVEAPADALAESEALIESHHGSHDDRLRYAVTPRFAISCSEAMLRGARELADAYDGVRLHTHASETRDEIERVEARTGRRNVAYLDDVGLTGPDVTLAHCVHTQEHEREILAETDTRVAHCPSANMKLGSGVAPVPDYLQSEIPVGLGNDGPPCNNTLDPFTEMRQAALLARGAAEDATALSARQVVRMATRDGARAVGYDDVGALREGWRADLVALSTDHPRATPVHDPLSHLVFAAHGDDVALTIVDGDVVYADGRFPGVDAASIMADASAYARRLS